MIRVDSEPKVSSAVKSAPVPDPPESTAVAARLYGQRLDALFSEVLRSTERLGLHVDARHSRRFPKRLALAFSYFESPMQQIFHWLFQPREVTNFTYDLTDINKDYLASFISVMTAVSVPQIRSYVDEPDEDDELRRHIRTVHPAEYVSGRRRFRVPHYPEGSGADRERDLATPRHVSNRGGYAMDPFRV